MEIYIKNVDSDSPKKFKIDLIVWKLKFLKAYNGYTGLFKIDLIVWKY